MEKSGDDVVNVVVLQTSDPFKYLRMLQSTSRTAIEFCRRNNFKYESYVGVRRGFHNSQAAYNRIFMLQDLVDSGFRGWALYLDADAYVYDIDFDLKSYLACKSDRSAIMATIPGTDAPWHINSGVLFFNLGQEKGRQIVLEWKRRFLTVPDSRLREMPSVWGPDDDQTLLFNTLSENAELRDSVFYEDLYLMNHKDARFIRQYLAVFEGDLGARTANIEMEVAYVLRDTPAASLNDITSDGIVTRLYQAILSREPDGDGLRHHCEVVGRLGPLRGMEYVVGALLSSDEYKSRIIT